MSRKITILLTFTLFFTAQSPARELVKAGEFDNGFARWTDWKISDAVTYEKSIDETGLLSGPNSAKFYIFTGSTTDWHIQFHYESFATQKSAKYYVSFMAGFDGIMESFIMPAAIRNPNTDVSPILLQHDTDLQFISEAAEHPVQFLYQADTSLANTQLNFFLGGHDDVEIWIDAVSIIEEGPFWLNEPFENMNDAVEVKFYVYPDSAFNGIVALTNGNASSHDDIVCALFFNPDGFLQVLNGQTFQADAAVTYELDKRIQVTVFADIVKQRYDVSVKPTGGGETKIATNYAFKQNVSSLNNLVTHVDIDPASGGRPLTGMRVTGIKTTAKTKVIEKTKTEMPAQTRLLQNYPNPFNPLTAIQFSLAHTERVSLKIFDINGTRVKNLVAGQYPAGCFEVVWDATDEKGHVVPSGVYYAQFKAGKTSHVRKMLLIR